MKFRFILVDTLPRLAWCACIRRSEKIVTVFHGPWVETNINFFCDGAWNGNFSKGDFDTATIFMGFGGKIIEDKVLFASPTHTLERLHLLEKGDEVFVSSSLPFLLNLSDVQLDRNYAHYQTDFLSIKLGLKQCVRSIPVQDGNRIRLFYYTNLLVDASLEIIEQPKNNPNEFADFADYKLFLEQEVNSVFENANSAARKVKYDPIATISSGYDSPTASVFAERVGCTEAITIKSSRTFKRYGLTGRSVEEGQLDSGKEIAELLGLNVLEYDREDYLDKKNFPEAEFLACGLMGSEMYMASFENILEGRILFTGHLGGSVWNKKLKALSSNMEPSLLARGDTSGSSLTEFRTRVGFIHLPLPSFGAANVKSLYRISNSKEMAPWSTGTRYDRPIPRRILEERGIPGNLFGRQKKAIDTVFPGRVEQVMTDVSYKNYAKFYAERVTVNAWVARLLHNLRHYLYRSKKYRKVNNRLRYSRFRKLFLGLKLPILSGRFYMPLGYDYLGFQWGVEKLLSRYQISVSAEIAEAPEDKNPESIEKIVIPL